MIDINALKDMVDLTSEEVHQIEVHRQDLLPMIKNIESSFCEWFAQKVGWQETQGLIFFPDFVSDLVKGQYDDVFVANQYNQAIHWHGKEIEATTSIAASSKLRILLHTMCDRKSPQLSAAICKVVDISQAIFAVVYHLADTLEGLKKHAEGEKKRIKVISQSFSQNSSSPLVKAYIDHLNWKLLAYSLALGNQTNVNDLPIDPAECDLGKWLNSGGKLAIDDELHEGFVSAHNRLHEIAHKMFILSAQNRPVSIVHYLLDMESASKEITSVLAIYIEKEMHKLVTIDSLTGAGNRRSFVNNLKLKIEESTRAKVGFGLIFADIDYFKRVNDTYGHAVGDQVLVEVSQRIKKSLRASDSEYRWGGEEFTVIVTVDNNDALMRIAERIHQSISETSIQTSSGPMKITISLGCKYYYPEQPIESERLLSCADAAMLIAKEKGRNRIVNFDTDIESLS